MAKRKFIQCAIDVALEADGLNQFHGSVVASGGKVVSMGHSECRTKLCGQVCSSLHAERAALSSAFRNCIIDGGSGCSSSSGGKGKRKNRHRGADLYVVRVSRQSARAAQNDENVLIRLSGSKPCVDCFKAAMRAGIKRIFYSTDEGTLKMIKVRDLSQDHFYMTGRQAQLQLHTFPLERIKF